MKFAQTIGKNMAAMGFAPNQQQNNQWQFSSRQISCTLIYFTNIITCSAYIFYKANETEEYMESIYLFAAVAGITIAFISMCLNNDKLFDILELASVEGNFSKFSGK